MKNILNRLFQNELLSKQEATEVLLKMANGEVNASQMASFLTVFQLRNITLSELSGFRDALLELAIPIQFYDIKTIDLCGTGGDGKNTFNISTLSSFIVAGAGAKVTKHGNYGVSSSCGSSNLLEYFGYKFTNNQTTLQQQLDKANICFLHAPLFNPAMKNIAPIRKELSVKTFFNMLGPMVNPSNPHCQIIGVFNLELARIYSYIYQELNKTYAIIHSIDGYDEISLTNSYKLISNTTETLNTPENVGFSKYDQSELFGGESVKQSAVIFINILNGNGTNAQNDVVLANSATALQCYNPEKSWEQCIELAKDSLFGKKALTSFKNLLN